MHGFARDLRRLEHRRRGREPRIFHRVDGALAGARLIELRGEIADLAREQAAHRERLAACLVRVRHAQAPARDRHALARLRIRSRAPKAMRVEPVAHAHREGRFIDGLRLLDELREDLTHDA